MRNFKWCCTYVVVLSLFISIFSSAIPTHAAESKIDLEYYEQVMNSSEKQIVIIKLKDEAVVSFSEKNQTALRLKSSSINNQAKLILDPYRAAELKEKQLSVFDSISTLIPTTLLHTYQNVYNGMAIEISGYNLRYLLDIPEVIGIYPAMEEYYATRIIGNKTVNAFESWKLKGKSFNNLSGKGTKVGIIDSGIDYEHNDFTPKGVGPDSRVKAGYDFVDGTNDCMDSGYGGNMPPHGTHVAGITSGRNPDWAEKTGVAPESDLYVYKVFSKKGGGANPANIIAAADQSVKDGCDVINLSLGHSGASESVSVGNPYYDALANADKAGTMVVAAAGNSGTRHKKNPWTIDTPGVFSFSLQVSASDDRLHQVFSFKPDNKDPIVVNANVPLFCPPFEEDISNVELIDCGYGTSEDFPSKVKGNIAFISRGPKDNGTTFQSKDLNAKEAGAIGCIIYNYDADVLNGLLVNTRDGELPEDYEFIPCAFVSGNTANAIKANLDGNYTLSFPVNSNLSFSDFSSTGPCFSADDNILKPEICAPGKQINSAVLDNKYENWDGTSMATPFVAGCVALIREAHPQWSTKRMKRIIMASSRILKNNVNGQFTSYFLQGAGEIDVNNAITSPIDISPSYVMRNIEQFGDPVTFTIQNVIDKDVTVSLSSELFESVITQIEDGHFDPIAKPATIDLSQKEITIRAGAKKTFTATFTLKDDAFINSKYEGAIWVNIKDAKSLLSSSEQHHLPVILWKDSLTKIKKSVSDFYFSQDILDLKANEEGYMHFNLNAGSILEIDTGSPQDTINFNNIATLITIHAYDNTGIDWGIVKSFENLPLGEYYFKWDGKSLEGNEFLPNGNFNLGAKIKGMMWDGSRNEVFETIVSDTDLKIEGSSIPQPPSFIITGPKKINIGEKFVINIGFREPLNIEEFSVELKFSRSKITPLNMYFGDFVDQENLKSKDCEFEKGTFYINGTRNPDWNGNGNAIIAQLEFKAKRSVDELEIKIIDYTFKDIDDNDRKTIFLLPDVTIEKEGATLGDFNDDGHINDLDFEILVEHYGLNWKDEKWIPDFDLNSDYYINIDDLKIFSRFYTPGT
ncbi:MAG: S8 family serine peptidase [Caldisericia bacterium]|nr:S8 family serine peptidase [Caldisericia bacterium]